MFYEIHNYLAVLSEIFHGLSGFSPDEGVQDVVNKVRNLLT